MPGLPLGPDRAEQFDDHLATVTDDRDLGVPVLGDLGRVDVGVHHRGLRGEAVQPAGDPVVEPGPERYQQVRLLQGTHGRHLAVHARHAQVLRMAAGERTARHQRGDHGHPGQFGQRDEVLARACLDHPAPDVQDRALRRHHHPGGLTHLAGVRPGDRVVAGQVERHRPAELGLGLQRVLRDVHQYRAGLAVAAT